MPTEHILNGRRIRGLTLWRPWPWAFTHADKRVENRPWKPPSLILGGYVALHAGLRFDQGACANMHNGLFGPAAAAIDHRMSAHPSGLIVAVAKVTSFHPHEGKPNGWEFGPYVWHLPVVSVLPTPVRCKGAQGLWRLSAGVFAEVQEQLERTPE